MNRRLFVGQILTGASVLSAPSSLIAHSLAPSSSQLATAINSKKVVEWIQSDLLGSLQHVTLSHVYSSERTALPALVAMVKEDMAAINALLGTNFTLTGQAALGMISSEYGSYTTQFEEDGVKLTWQALARIGGETKKPTAQLRLFGSKGAVQAAPNGRGYQFVDWQGKVISQPENQFGKLATYFNRRTLFTNFG